MRIAAFFILLIAWLHADVLTFTPSTTKSVTNYTIHYGPHPSRAVTNRVQIGLATGWTITNVPPSTVAFLFATAWAGGQESDPSSEITYTNLQWTVRLNMVLEQAASPGGPYLPLTNQLNYIAAMDSGAFYRVRMEASMEHD